MATRSSVRDGAWPCYAFLGRLVQYICTNTTVGASMQTINISDFRANLLKYLEIANSGEIISITSNGRLLATITPPAQLKDQAKRQLKALAAKAKVHDVTSPIDESWEAMS
ncbi:MAG: type II toxin-antitoxin system Phd/YefM family antitoxin [Pseudomonadales bacterium]